MTTESVLLVVYFTGLIATLLFWLGAVGYCLQRRGRWLKIYNMSDALPASLFGSLCAGLWPLAILSLPFFAGRLIGKLAEQRELRRREERAQEYGTLLRLRNTFDEGEAEWALLDQALREVS